MDKTTQEVLVAQIELDAENPRIRAAIQRQGLENPSQDEISFHLSAAVSSVGSGGHAYRRLRESIKAASGAYQPVSLLHRTPPPTNGQPFLCLDGNTRVAIYRELAEDGVSGNWTTIKAEILVPDNDAERVRATEHIRMISHIVGAREWSPYRQAKYLHELRHDACFSWDHIVALCGGDVTQAALSEDITAYEMMEDYRDRVPPGSFNEHRFSAYRELVKIRGPQLLETHDMTLDNFHNWVANGVLTKDEQVRHLRSVLADPDARSIVSGGRPGSLQEAIDHVNDKRRADRHRAEHTEHLRESTLLDLARALANRLDGTTLTEIRALQQRTEELTDLLTRLRRGTEQLAGLVEN